MSVMYYNIGMNKNPLDKMMLYYEDFTKTDKELSAFFINNAHDAICGMSSEEIAKKTGTSKAALSRFCKRIGYSGFSDFRFDLARSLVSSNASVNENVNSVVSITSLYSQYILDIQRTVNEQEVKKIAEVLVDAKRIKILGSNRSYNSALQFKQRLNRMGIDAEACSDKSVFSDLIEICDSNDVFIIFSTTDNMHIYESPVKIMHDRKIPVVFLTMNPNLSFRKYVDYYIVLPRVSKDASMSFLDDQPIFMVFIEIMLNLIAKSMQEK